VRPIEDSSRWAGRAVLVTGARGFIGARLCQRLVRAGARVHGVSRRPVGADASGVQWIQADLAGPDAACRLLRTLRPAVVFHLAGRVVGDSGLANVEPTLTGNLAATVHLLLAAVEHGQPRLVLAGSMHEPPSDDPAAIARSPYAVSKWACGAYARMFHALYGAAITVATPFMVYGPGQRDLTKVLPYVIVSLLKSEVPHLGTGRQAFDWVYVDDVVDGFVSAAASGSIDADPIDLGTGAAEPVRDIVERIVNLCASGARVQFGAASDRPFESARVADIDATRRRIGWRASTTIDEGLRRTVDWYRTQVEAGLL